MQPGRDGRDNSFGFGDPFAGFGRPGGMISSFFGGRNPFDDPFFTQPFGGRLGPSMFGRSMFNAGGSLFEDPTHAGFLEHQAPQVNKTRGPVIRELSSDDDDEGQGEDGCVKKENPRNHFRSGKEPYVLDPDEEMEEKKGRHMQLRGEYSRAGTAQPQTHSYSFQSSTVTYGGPNGAYHTSSTTRRTGGDGVTVEESKEANTTTGKAAHRISKGLRDKGHSVTRKLNSDGRVDTMQTLHNLNEDELTGFEEEWKGNAREYLPAWNQGSGMLDDGNRRSSRGSGRTRQASQGGWALPATEQQQNPRMGSRARYA